MTRPGGRAGQEESGTLASLFLAAMRRHDRAGVLLHQDGTKWRETPDWRLERQVIRLALFLRERASLVPGDRVAILSRLRPESVAEGLAAIALGAAALEIDSTLPTYAVRRVNDHAA